MADNVQTAAERAAADIMAKIDATTSGLSDGQRAEVETVARAQMANFEADILAKLDTRTYKPEPAAGSELAGTRYARMGMNEIDVQLLHGIVADAKRAGIAQRGPSEELDNLVTALQKRAAVDDGPHSRAMDTSETTALIGANYTSQVWQAARQQAVVLPLLRSFPMARATDYIPVFGAPPVPVAYPESVADDSADYSTQDVPFARVTATAKKYGLHQKWSGEMEEESLIPFISAVRENQQNALAIYGDEIVVSGDTVVTATGNINSDDAALASNHYLVQQDGIRKGALVDNTANVTNASGALTYAMLTGARLKCLDRTRKVDWGNPANASQFVYLASPEAQDKIDNLDEVITIDKFGPNATVMTGQIARVGQNPIIVTQAVPQTETDGKANTASISGTLYGQIVAFNTNAVAIGVLRQVTVETYRRPERDQNGIILFWRMAVARYTPTGAASGIEWVSVIYGI